MRIYVGNLSYRSSEQDVRKAFEAFGQVESTRLAIDPKTGRSAGFAYIEMSNVEEAQAAIARLNGKEINSRVVTVNQATMEEAPAPPERRERPPRPSFGREDSRRHAPRGARGEQSRAAPRPRSDDRPRSAPRPRSDDRPRGEHQAYGEQRGHNQPGPRNVWEARQRRGQPTTTQRETRPSDANSRSIPPTKSDLAKSDPVKNAPAKNDPAKNEAAKHAPGPNVDERPVPDNPWTRRRLPNDRS